MIRPGMTVCLVFALTAWPTAHSQPPLTTAEQTRLFQAHRLVLGQLIDNGLDLARANSSLERVEGSRRLTQTLVQALSRAIDEPEPDSAIEYGNHLTRVVKEALSPTLQEAEETIPAESPEAARLKAIRQGSIEALSAAIAALPERGRLASQPPVRQLREELAGLRDGLRQTPKAR